MQGQQKYFIKTYGCQMNVHESEKIAGALSELGYEKGQSEEDSDIIVFNTCCIRENAENTVFGNVGALKSRKKVDKNLIIAVGGCMTQQDGAADSLKEKFQFIDIIFGTHNLHDFKRLVELHKNTKKTIIEIVDDTGCLNESTTKNRSSYPNAWINITYGCNNFCTYCIVPYVRGREKSRKMADIVNEAEQLLSDGYKEITLLGQNVNSYGNDLGDGSNFAKLLKAMPFGKYRLRFMTNHPKDLTEDMVKVMSENEHICKYIHLPVQAGSNAVLKNMNRGYTREDYIEKVKLIRRYMPDCQISTDIMVGFPGESEEDFLQTLDLVNECNFSNAFTFVYSSRKGTKAEKMTNHIDEGTKKDRIMRLVDLVNKKVNQNAEIFLDTITEVLCERYDREKKLYFGRNEYNYAVSFESDRNLKGEFVNIKVDIANNSVLKGRII